ncbi:hypothetical protein RHMOL_Rhmol06G0240700 [Rhododendron molle]|uniref:Uncharacterized protein n=1 Tax=Rhododendron molle TaxID=49168 RepID=A0ACC0NFU5_RHOML|nr:hypothetical protein RHMOL_Rhmol06G0240700 [Rhododendron molle]
MFRTHLDSPMPTCHVAGNMYWNRDLDGLQMISLVNSTAITAACELILSLGLKEVEVESDNKKAISLSVSELVPPWDARAVVLDIRHMAVEEQISFRWVSRIANRAAHEVAALARHSLLPCNWNVNPPLSLLSILCNERSM